jgi:predicted RNA-binding protein
MCEANAYFIEDGKEVLVLASVDKVEPEGGGLKLTSIFGEQMFVAAKIASLSLVDHKVFLAKLPA